MIIAIEGMDGSGKTSISKIVANKIGYKYLDKPILRAEGVNDDDE